MVLQLQNVQERLYNTSIPPPAPSVGIDQLLLALQIIIPVAFSNTAELVTKLLGAERDYVFHISLGLPVQAQSRISTVVQDLRFQTWLYSPSSQIITIIAMDDDTDMRDMSNMVSPLSYLCSMLTRTANKSQFVHAITFCRFHMDPDDRLSREHDAVSNCTDGIVNG